MNIPIELIDLILSFIPKKKCYRCNNIISPIDVSILYNDNVFCSTYCTEYQHF